MNQNMTALNNQLTASKREQNAVVIFELTALPKGRMDKRPYALFTNISGTMDYLKALHFATELNQRIGSIPFDKKNVFYHSKEINKHEAVELLHSNHTFYVNPQTKREASRQLDNALAKRETAHAHLALGHHLAQNVKKLMENASLSESANSPKKQAVISQQMGLMIGNYNYDLHYAQLLIGGKGYQSLKKTLNAVKSLSQKSIWLYSAVSYYNAQMAKIEKNAVRQIKADRKQFEIAEDRNLKLDVLK